MNDWTLNRHGSGLPTTNIVKELWLPVHVPRRTVPQMCGELGERDVNLWEMGLLCCKLLSRRLRCRHWYYSTASSWINYTHIVITVVLQCYCTQEKNCKISVDQMR